MIPFVQPSVNLPSNWRLLNGGLIHCCYKGIYIFLLSQKKFWLSYLPVFFFLLVSCCLLTQCHFPGLRMISLAKLEREFQVGGGGGNEGNSVKMRKQRQMIWYCGTEGQIWLVFAMLFTFLISLFPQVTLQLLFHSQLTPFRTLRSTLKATSTENSRTSHVQTAVISNSSRTVRRGLEWYSSIARYTMYMKFPPLIAWQKCSFHSASPRSNEPSVRLSICSHYACYCTGVCVCVCVYV